jgi:serine/threonine protein phosphatase PrpC
MTEHDEPTVGNGRLRAGAVMGKFSWGYSSDPGPVRDHNEDFVATRVPTTPDDAWDRAPLFALADGMGGHAAGEVASRVAVQTVLETFGSATVGGLPQMLRSSVRAANAAVSDASREHGRSGMGTTLLVAGLSGREVVLAHIGDSRAYLVRGDSCIQLTNDHSRVGEMVRMRMISPEQAAHHPARSQLTRSLGGDPFVQIDLIRQAIETEDVLILCSDGVWDVIARHELMEISTGLNNRQTPTALEVADRLVADSVERGATDNVSVLVVHITSELPIPPTGRRRLRFRRSTP